MSNETVSALPLLAVAIPAVGAGVVFLIGAKRERLRDYLSVTLVGMSLILVVAMGPAVVRGQALGFKLMKIIPRIWLAFRVDELGLLFAGVAASLWLLATIYSLGYMKDEHARTRYYTFLLLCLAWTLGVGLSANLFTLLIFYELFSISTYPLIIHEETPEAMAAGRKYMIYILIGGAAVLFAIVLTYFLSGSLSLDQAGLSLKGEQTLLQVLFWSYIAGFGVKGAIMPLHAWVPDAHPIAPSPFSALLSGVMVAAGTFGIMRAIFNVFGAHLVKEMGVGVILGYIVSFTIVASSILALNQDNLKRRLAYSTIGQMSYIILGTGLLTFRSVWGGMIHIANHAFMKGTLFLCAGIIIKQLGKKNISEMRGIGRKIPVTMAVFTVACLGMIGTPPLAGFISKWYLCLGSLDAHNIFFVVVLLISSLLGAAYFLPIVYTAFFQKPKDEKESGNHSAEGNKESRILEMEAPGVMLVPIIIGAVAVLVLGLFSKVGGLPLFLAKAASKFFLK